MSSSAEILFAQAADFYERSARAWTAGRRLRLARKASAFDRAARAAAQAERERRIAAWEAARDESWRRLA